MRTLLVGRMVSFEVVCVMAREMLGITDGFKPDVLYAPESARVRLLPGCRPLHILPDTLVPGREFQGLDAHTIQTVTWTSCDGAAELMLWKSLGTWLLEYKGPQDDDKPEYPFLLHWAKAVNPEKQIEIGCIRDGAVRMALRDEQFAGKDRLMIALGLK